MKIYTKTGDNGTTALFGGTRVKKYNLRIESYGTVDELNSYIGLIKDQEISDNIKKTLLKIQNELLKDSMSLKVFDAYRPQQAVDHFVEWEKDLNDTLMKKIFYPKVPKKKLFELGFIAEKSGHTRGSSVDLTIIDLKTNEELDMGSIYDFFGIESHPCSKKININQQNNRLFLRTIMLQNNFSPYENEWWHFTLKNEPFSQRYFNFPIR